MRADAFRTLSLCWILVGCEAGSIEPSLRCVESQVMDGAARSLSLARGQVVLERAADATLVFAAQQEDGRWRVEPLDKPALDGPEAVAVAVDGEARPHIVYASPVGVTHLTPADAGDGWSMTVIGPGAAASPSVAVARTAGGDLAIAFRASAGVLFAEMGASSVQPIAIEAADARHIQLAVDPAGAAQVIYHDRSLSAIRSARPHDQSIATLLTGEVAGLSALLDAESVRHLAYGDGSVLRYARDAGPSLAAEDVAAGTDPHLAVADDGRVHLLHFDGQGAVIAIREGGAWTHHRVPGSDSAIGGAAALDIDELGALHVIHQQERERGVVVLHARCEAP